MARLVILAAAAAVLFTSSLSFSAEAVQPNLAASHRQQEAARQRSASASQSNKPQLNKGPFHPRPSQAVNDRQRSRLEERKRRMRDAAGGRTPEEEERRKAHLDQTIRGHTQRSESLLGDFSSKIPAAGGGAPNDIQDLLNSMRGHERQGHEFTAEQTEQLQKRAQKQKLKQQQDPFDPNNANPEHHYFSELLNQAAPGPDATPEEQHAYSTRMARLKHQYLTSQPRNVQPTAPNFGLRYRVTHMATLSFQAQNLEDPAGGAPIDMGNITIALFGKTVPKTVENFVGLCNGVNGFGYVNSTIHRILDGFIIQGGDIEASSDGLGGYSMHAEEDEDDKAEIAAVRAAAEGEAKSESRSVSLDNPSYTEGKKSSSKSLSASSSRSKNRYIDHENYLIPHGAGTISMAAAHRSQIGSQFYLTLDDAHALNLNRRFVAFGHIVFGFKTTVYALQRLRTDADNKPLRTVTISGCKAVEYSTEAEESLAKEGKRQPRSRQLRDDHYTAEHFTKAREEVERLRRDDESQSIPHPAGSSLPPKVIELEHLAKGPRLRDDTNARASDREGRQNRFREHREAMRKRMEDRMKPPARKNQ